MSSALAILGGPWSPGGNYIAGFEDEEVWRGGASQKEGTISLNCLLGLEPAVMKEVRGMLRYYLLPTLIFDFPEALHKGSCTALE